MSADLPMRPRRGLTERAEHAFERASNVFLLVLAAAWVYTIVSERASGKVNLVTPATAAAVTALSTPSANSAVYVTDAVANAVSADAIGESGKLRAQIREASSAPGIVKAAIQLNAPLKAAASDFSLITPRAATDVRRGRLGLYYIGTWPSARKTKGGAVTYEPPSGFVEVTPANADTRLSEHFRLRDFLTHDQPNVWPKYEVVSLKLVDKLELVLDDLKGHGIDPDGVHVMSGFRTPQYNHGGGDPAGRADLSRHMYGDAADIYIDDNGDGRMDDLNHDGRVDINDARVILAAVDRVERAHPDLVGGCGVYAGNGAHGPFTHIDTRGYPARWVYASGE